MPVDSTMFKLFFLSLFLPSYVFAFEYCVIGAGPAGLQMGYFFERSGRDYMIFERNTLAGSFFTKYPRHGKIISINKRFTGRTNKEFNLRHDWNSLLSDDESLLIRHYSEDFFPRASALVKYLNDYAEKLNLKIQYSTNVTVERQGNDFALKDQHGRGYMCKNVIMSTGLGAENIPSDLQGIEYTESYADISINPKDYEGQSVLIIGRGNSGFETAASIVGSANFIHMFARSRIRLSWSTHYVGDLRAINNDLLDTYQLKSLDGLLDLPIEIIAIKKKNGKLYVDTAIGKGADNFAIRDPYDRVIRCMGFKFDYSVFENGSTPRPSKGRYLRKFPEMTHAYESTSVPHLYYAGVNSHYVDFRKSAGGFIHGFRYTGRALHRLLEWKNHGVKWPHINVPITYITGVIIKRINEASGIYQMFGVLGEVLIFRPDNTVDYFEEFPVKLVGMFEEHSGHRTGPMVIINMEYGKDYSGPGKDVFHSNRAATAGVPSIAHLSNFLHPVFYFYKTAPENMTVPDGSLTQLPRPDRLHIMVEDFLTLWDAPISHILLLRRFLENITQKDLRLFFAHSCFEMLMTYKNVPDECNQQYFEGKILPGSKTVLATAKSIGLTM